MAPSVQTNPGAVAEPMAWTVGADELVPGTMRDWEALLVPDWAGRPSKLMEGVAALPSRENR